MKSYSVSRMRKECQVLYQMLLTEAVLLLVFSAAFGALWKVLEQGEGKDPFTVIGVFLLMLLFLLGSYLVVSDPKWLLKHTLYGKTLTNLGDAALLMEEIDREAKAMAYECASFALMTHWLVLYQAAMPQSRAIRSRPVPFRHIARIGWEKETDEENGGFFVRFILTDGTEWETFVWENADIEALRQWGAAQEKG